MTVSGFRSARLADFVDETRDVVGIANPAGGLVYLNPAGRGLLGLEARDSVARLRLSDMHPPEMESFLVSEVIPKAVREGAWRGESKLVARGGREMPVSQMVVTRKRLDGRLDGIASIARPITFGDAIDGRTKSRETHGILLVEALPIGVIIADLASSVTYVNLRFAEMLGFSREELIGRPVASLVCPMSSSVFAEWERSMHGDQSDPIEVALFRRDGSSTWAQLSVVPPLHHGGALQGVCVVATDIADRVQREAEQRRSSEELRALSAKLVKVQERECQRIATDLHDGLGQSLTAMKYGLEQTLCQLRAGATGASVPMLEVLLARLKDAVGEVRRVAMNARPSTLDDLGVVATLSWLFREFETIYPDIAVRRHVDIAERDLADEQKVAVYRIVQEAMNNIAKHSQASVVDVSLRRIDDHLELVILDNGRGFDPEAVALRPAGAFGLGLGSIRDRAIFAGGTHSLRASVGKGVEIRVSLPLAVGVPEQCGEAGPAGGTVANAGVQLQRK